jgi:hypothetical protein
VREETPPSLLASATTEALLHERFIIEGFKRLVYPEIRQGGPVTVPPVSRDILRLEERERTAKISKERESLSASLDFFVEEDGR